MTIGKVEQVEYQEVTLISKGEKKIENRLAKSSKAAEVFTMV